MESNRGIIVKGQGKIIAKGNIINGDNNIVDGDNNSIVQTQGSSPAERSKELETLVNQFLAETSKIPEQFAAERSVIAKLIGELREELGKEKPSALQTKISAEGLVSAAATLQKIVPGLLGLARSIVRYFV